MNLFRAPTLDEHDHRAIKVVLPVSGDPHD
jgi:hypothetical protein